MKRKQKDTYLHVSPPVLCLEFKVPQILSPTRVVKEVRIDSVINQ